MSARHRWRRGDGTVLSCTDLTDAVPMTLDEIEDIKDLLDLLEEWLRFEDSVWDLLTDWLYTINNYDPDEGGPEPSVQDVIKELAGLNLKLHRILQAGVPDTGHRHPPTPAQGR